MMTSGPHLSYLRGTIAPLPTHLGLEFLELSNCQISHVGDRLHRDIPFEALNGDLHRYLFSNFPKGSGLFYLDIAH
jgi:hypothetical protein